MFLPVTMNNAERIVETIKEIKEKIPADPFEAELILMAEMVAEQSGTIDKAEAPKEKVTDRAKDKREEAAPEGKRRTSDIRRREVKGLGFIHSHIRRAALTSSPRLLFISQTTPATTAMSWTPTTWLVS